MQSIVMSASLLCDSLIVSDHPCESWVMNWPDSFSFSVVLICLQCGPHIGKSDWLHHASSTSPIGDSWIGRNWSDRSNGIPGLVGISQTDRKRKNFLSSQAGEKWFPSSNYHEKQWSWTELKQYWPDKVMRCLLLLLELLPVYTWLQRIWNSSVLSFEWMFYRYLMEAHHFRPVVRKHLKQKERWHIHFVLDTCKSTLALSKELLFPKKASFSSPLPTWSLSAVDTADRSFLLSSSSALEYGGGALSSSIWCTILIILFCRRHFQFLFSKGNHFPWDSIIGPFYGSNHLVPLDIFPP